MGMASSFTVEIDISKFNPEGDLHAFITEVDLELHAGAVDIEREAVSRAPVNLGNLKSSIVIEPKAPNGGLKYEVVCGAVYAPFIEFGTRKQVKVPSGYEQYAAQFKGASTGSTRSFKEAILQWMKDKGIDMKFAYPIMRKIMIEGIKPQPFMIPAFEMFKDEIIKRIQWIK